MYTTTLSLTSALYGVGSQRHVPAALPRGRDPERIVQEDGWALGPVWTVRKMSLPPGFDVRIVCP